MSDDLLSRLADLIGPTHVLTGTDMEAYAFDQRKRHESKPLAVLRPGSTEQVAAIVRLCAEARVPLVPQGGNTGLVGGTIAVEGTGALILNLGRLNRIRVLDAADYTITAEAGCVLADIQAAAEAADRYFPLSLGAEGTCMLGGNLSSNAGGILTLRYGNARDLVLGLEVVLPDGRVWHGLRTLRKDNSGYDLKHLFLGAEGTLGIITAASLKLYPRPRQVETALVAVPDPAAAVTLLGLARTGTGDSLSAFELMPRFAIDGAREILGRDQDPLSAASPWYVLMEASSGMAGPLLRQQVEAVLETALEQAIVTDAIFADSGEQVRKLWLIREGLPEIGRKIGGAVHTDISVPVSRIPDFLAATLAAVADYMPGIRPYPFGHVGDGNIHFNVGRPADMEGAAYLAHAHAITDLVHGQALVHGGSISAEHGIGNHKADELARIKDPVEMDLMRAVKGLLDPAGIMNPGKVLLP
ncbi:FAD-binding oxidoreductase [Niveispirillum sp. KHB5.9]|uniref:FAD-binding oxidoreductase n=1 Tax=Niveispirillum sp. KHB5.9 TaxID=3400269 RepID=UPI003A8763FF